MDYFFWDEACEYPLLTESSSALSSDNADVNDIDHDNHDDECMVRLQFPELMKQAGMQNMQDGDD